MLLDFDKPWHNVFVNMNRVWATLFKRNMWLTYFVGKILNYKNSNSDILVPDKIDRSVQLKDVAVPLHNDLLSGYAQQGSKNLLLTKKLIRMWRLKSASRVLTAMLIKTAEGTRNPKTRNLLLLVRGVVVSDTCRTQTILVQPLNKTYKAILISDTNPYTFSTVQHNFQA